MGRRGMGKGIEECDRERTAKKENRTGNKGKAEEGGKENWKRRERDRDEGERNREEGEIEIWKMGERERCECGKWIKQKRKGRRA